MVSIVIQTDTKIFWNVHRIYMCMTPLKQQIELKKLDERNCNISKSMYRRCSRFFRVELLKHR